MREYNIAAIPADGIGPEVIAAGLQALAALEKRVGGFRLHVEEFPWGSEFYRRTGMMMPADGLATLRKFDAIYFGAVGAPDVPDHVTLWACACRSARASTNMPMCARPRSCLASPRRSPIAAPATWTG